MRFGLGLPMNGGRCGALAPFDRLRANGGGVGVPFDRLRANGGGRCGALAPFDGFRANGGGAGVPFGGLRANGGGAGVPFDGFRANDGGVAGLSMGSQRMVWVDDIAGGARSAEAASPTLPRFTSVRAEPVEACT
jgi:hypothetical protein